MARAARVSVSSSANDFLPSDKVSIPTDNRPTLLWIDDFKPALALYQATMESLGFRVLIAASGAAGVKLFLLHHVDLVITDYEMPELKGDAVARMLKAIDPKVLVIMFSGTTLLRPESRRWVDAFCDKAGSRSQLMNSIHRLLGRKHPRTLQPAALVAASQGERQRTVA